MSDELNIANSSEVVEQCVEKVQSASDKFVMLKVQDNTACQGIDADNRCNDTYSRGVKVAANYKDILEELIKNMKQIDKVLVDADNKVSTTNTVG